jgi:S1-C subfamily serine protease
MRIAAILRAAALCASCALIVMASAMILLPSQGHAQTLNHLLRGVSKVQLVIENLAERDKECGLTEQAIRAAVMYPLSSTKIEVGSSHVALYVAANSLSFRAASLCVTHYSVQVFTAQSVTLEFSGHDNFAQIELWNSGSILSSDRSDHARRVTGSIEQRVKAFITDWNLDNKPDVQSSGKPRSQDHLAISSGSGFAVTEAGHLVTNEHVVSKCSTVTVKQGEHELTGTIAFRDSAADLALIRLTNSTKMSFARLRQSSDLKMGDQAIAYGFPLRGSLADEGNLTLGNVSAMHGLKNNPNEIQISAPVQPGNSGGPLLDSSGNVIGVVNGKLDALNALARNGDIPQNINFAISLPVLKEFLAGNGVPTTEAASRFELRPDEVGERAKAFTYAIECDSTKQTTLDLVRSKAEQPQITSPPSSRSRKITDEQSLAPTTGNPSPKRERSVSNPKSGNNYTTRNVSPAPAVPGQPLSLYPN